MLARQQLRRWTWARSFFPAQIKLRGNKVICARCFHAIAQLHADKPLSPAERFRQSWSKPEENASAEPKPIPTLDEISNPTHKVYRTSKIEDAKPNVLEIIEAAQEDQLRQIEDEAEVEALESQNEEETDFDFEVFEGENTRGYVGLLPLADMEAVNPKHLIKQGSLIETRGKFTSTCIVVTDRYLRTHRRLYGVNSRGKILSCRNKDIYFTIPNFAPLEQAQAVDDALETEFQPYPKFPDRKAQVAPGKEESYRRALASLASRLTTLSIEKDRALDQVRKTVDSVYDSVRPLSPTKKASIFTPDLAKTIFRTDEPSYAQLFATHRLLADDPMHFIPDPTRHMETASFIIRSQRDMLLVQRVSAWIRDNSDVMQAFMDKCRRIIKISRSLPAPVEPTLLQQEIPKDLWFTRDDRRIIEYIAGYVTGRRGFATDDLLSLTPMLIKRLGMYGADITPEPDRNAARLLLTEIGAWQPSENLAIHTEAATITQQIYQPRKAVDLYSSDNLAEFRHDFGTQTVYVIDDASAHELDDGISMETTSEGTWLHVHIANPSAFFGPASQIAKMARLRQTSLYLPDTTYRMFPTIGSGGDGFSRGSSETPTMTFSARLGDDGNIIDFKVRPGIVRNVKIMTYADVDSKVLSAAKIPERAWWTAAYSAPRHEGKEFSEIAEDTRLQILSMTSVVKAHREWRIRNGALKFDLPSTNINVSPAPPRLEPSHPPSPEDPMQPMSEYTIPTFIRGYAGVKVSVGSRRSPASVLIEEMMIIAGRIAGLAARENNLPVAYRGLSAPIPDDLRQRCYDLHRSGEEYLPPNLSRQVISTSGTWDLRLSPKPLTHELLGIPAKEGGYVQVSSPLRRYLDVLAHWQFEAFLKQSPFPFTFADLSGTQEFSLHQAQRRIFRRVLFTRQVNRFYATHALTQFLRDPSGIGSTHLEMENGKPKLTGIYLETGMIGVADAIPRLINIPELGIVGMVLLGLGQRWPPFETQFPVEIDKVDEIFGITTFRLAK